MITKFDSSYVVSVDLDNPGYLGTPVNERLYPNEVLADVLHKAVAYAKQTTRDWRLFCAAIDGGFIEAHEP